MVQEHRAFPEFVNVLLRASSNLQPQPNQNDPSARPKIAILRHQEGTQEALRAPRGPAPLTAKMQKFHLHVNFTLGFLRVGVTKYRCLQ